MWLNGQAPLGLIPGRKEGRGGGREGGHVKRTEEPT